MKPLNQYSKSDLRHMFDMAIIDKCMTCGKYHINHDKPDWPYSNISECKECRERRLKIEKLKGKGK